MKWRFPNSTISKTPDRGAALLTVLVAIMIITLMTMELQYNAMVERKLAYNDLNQLQAYYLAKSGARLGLLRINLFARARKDKSLAAAAGIDIKPFLDAIWNTPLPAFPPAVTSLAKLNKADKDAAEKQLEETKISAGQFSTVITSESSKINLNYLILPQEQRTGEYNAINFTSGNPPQNLVQHVGTLLYNVIQDIFKNSDNPVDEFGNLRPEEVVYDIMDWVNPGSVRISSNNKDGFYEQQKPPYRAKRGRFFTLEELKMVRSINDPLYAKLKSHVTVYSYDGKVNLNEASNDLLKAIYPDFTEDDIKRIAEEKAKIGTWATEKVFVDFVVNTLGRSGFKTIYSDEAKYPFTVSSFSFVIDSLGTLTKNKVSIQKKIRVAVALTSGKTSQAKPDVKTKEECEKDANYFWYLSAVACYPKPSGQKDCENRLAGGWQKNGDQFQCLLNNQGFIAPPPGNQAADPNAMKVLYWMET